MMHDFKISQLRTFVTIVEQGGFRAAAERLHKSQAAVSLAMKSLEEQLDKRLFGKGNHAKLTDFGRYFLKYTKSLLEHHDEVQYRLARGTHHDNASVTIAMLPSVAQHLMPRYVKGFLAQYPNARLTLRDTGSARIQALIKARKVDIGISTLHDTHAGLSVKQLMQDAFGVVCHCDHPLAAQAKITWAMVADYQLIANGTWDILPPRQAQYLYQAATMTMVNMSSLNAALGAQLGVTVLPQLAYTEHSELVFLPLNHPTVYRQIGVIKDNHRELSPMAEQFFEYMVRPLQ